MENKMFQVSTLQALVARYVLLYESDSAFGRQATPTTTSACASGVAAEVAAKSSVRSNGAYFPIVPSDGDEFTVIVQGNDYEQLEDRLAKMRDCNERALRSGGVVIACGMAVFRNDTSVDAVFYRADRNMYEDRNRLKLRSANTEA